MGLFDDVIDIVKKFFSNEDEKEKILMESDAKINAINAKAMAQIAINKADNEAKLRLKEKEAEKIRLETESKLKIAEKENEKIILMREAQRELIAAQEASQIAIEKARAEGMEKIANQFVILQEKLLDVAKKRIEIIELGSLPIVREIENFYSEVGDKIQLNAEEYNTKNCRNFCRFCDSMKKILLNMKFIFRKFKMTERGKIIL